MNWDKLWRACGLEGKLIFIHDDQTVEVDITAGGTLQVHDDSAEFSRPSTIWSTYFAPKVSECLSLIRIHIHVVTCF